jgi:hypothetical protein
MPLYFDTPFDALICSCKSAPLPLQVTWIFSTGYRSRGVAAGQHVLGRPGRCMETTMSAQPISGALSSVPPGLFLRAP